MPGDLYSNAIEAKVRERFRTLNAQFTNSAGQPIAGRMKNGTFVPDDPKIARDMKRNPLNFRRHPFQKANGVPITEDEFVAIDTLARTLVGEMGLTVCQPYQVYMESVAKVIYNRALRVKTSPAALKRFCRGACSADDSLPDRIAGVSLAPKQFSMWNKLRQTPRNEKRNQKILQQRVFCPN